VAKWVAVVVVLFVVPSWVADRLVEAFERHWWTELVRVGPMSAAFQWWLTIVTRPADAVRWSWVHGWVREKRPEQET
jgi:hypothetical protein